MILTVSHYTSSIIFHSVFKYPLIFIINISEIFYKRFFPFVLSNYSEGSLFFLPAILSLQHLLRGADFPRETPQMGDPHLPQPPHKMTARKKAMPPYLGMVNGDLSPLSVLHKRFLNECVYKMVSPFTEIRVPNLLPDVTYSWYLFICPSQGDRGEVLRCMLRSLPSQG